MELTTTQKDMAERLAAHAKEACDLVGLQCSKASARHFYLTVHRYYGRVQNMTAELERCIDWCMSKNKRIFTAQRFGNWCANKVKWNKEQELRGTEMRKLKFGNVHERAEHARRIAASQARVVGQQRKEDATENDDDGRDNTDRHAI